MFHLVVRPVPVYLVYVLRGIMFMQELKSTVKKHIDDTANMIKLKSDRVYVMQYIKRGELYKWKHSENNNENKKQKELLILFIL